MFFDKNKEKFTIKDRTFIPRHSCSTEGVSFYICVEMGFVFADVKCRLSDWNVLQLLHVDRFWYFRTGFLNQS